MAEDKEPWNDEFTVENKGENPWDQDFEVEDTSKKKDPTFVSPKKPVQESVSPYQDSGSKSVSPQPPSVSSSGYKFEPVKQPVQTSYEVVTQEKEPYSELNKDKGTVEGAIKANAKIIQQRAKNAYDEIDFEQKRLESYLNDQNTNLTNLKSEIDRQDPNSDVYKILAEDYNRQVAEYNSMFEQFKANEEKKKKLSDAEFMASQAEQVGKDLQLNKSEGAGDIFMRSAWNAFVPATVKGIGALISLAGATTTPNILLQTAGNFIVDFGNDLEAEIPTKAQGSVLDGFTFDKAANIAGSGVGSMAAMLLPVGALGKAGKAAQLATAWGSSSLQTMGGVYDEARKAGLSDNKAAYLSLAIGLPVGAVDAVSGARFFGSKRAAKELVDVAVKELSGRTITPAILSEVADRSVKTVIKDRGIDILQEGATGAVQQAIEEGVKAGYDKATGDNAFNVTAESAAKNIFDSAFGEAFGAGFVNTISGSKDLILKKGKITESAYNQAVKVGKDKASREYFRKMLETSVKNGVITQEESDNIKKNVNAIIEADKLIPSSIKKVEKRTAAVELLREKNSLEAQIEGKDKSLTVKQQERIKAIDSELQAIASGRESVTMKRRKMESEKVAEPVVEKAKEVVPAEIEKLREIKNTVGITPEEQAILDEYDSKNKPGLSSEVGGGEASIQTESIKKEGEKTVEASGVVQAQGQVQPVKEQVKGISQNAKPKVDAIKSASLETEDGATFNLDGTVYEGGGVVIPVTSSPQMSQAEITPEKIQEFVEANMDKIPEGSTVKPGIYKFPNSDKVSIDLNIVVPKEKADIALEFAKRSGQESIFDLDTFENRKTGADGKNPREYTSEQFYEIADSLSKGVLPKAVSETKSRDQFIADKKQELKDDEGADYNESLDPFYDKYFGSQFDFLYGENVSEEESAVREKILGEVDRVKSALSSVAPGIKIVSHGTTDSFRQALKDAGSTDEEVQQKKLGGGFYDSNTNEIHLNLPEVRSNTLFHEGVHPILNAIEAIDENLIDKLYKQVVEVEKRAGVEGKYTEDFANRYDEAQQKMEAITEFLADVADGTIEINETNLDKIKKIFIDLMDAIGIDVSGVIKTVSDLKELADKINVGFSTGDVIKVGEVSPENIKEADSGKNPFIQSQLPVKSLEDVLSKYGNKAIAINSDPTKVGKVKLPSGKEIELFGGVMYVGIDENVKGEVGFAASKFAKVKMLNNMAKDVFSENNGEGVVLIVAQKPESMLGNYYSLVYALDAVKMLPKTIINSKQFRDEFFGKDILALKDAFGSKYNDFVNKYSKKDFKSDAEIDEMINELMSDIGNSFEARKSLIGNILGGIVSKSARKGSEDQKGFVSKTPGKFIAKQLFERFGVNQESLFRAFGQKELIDDYFDNGGYGYVAAGFIHDAKVDINEVQNKGLVHPQFNAKFHGKDAFITDSLYDVNKLFPAITGVDKKGKPFSTSAYTQVSRSMYPKGKVESVSSAKSKTKGIQAQKPIKGDLIANSPKSKFMTEDGEGNYVFYHYSSSDLSKKGIDPNKTGKNIITSKTEKLLAPASFYYTEPNIQEPGTGEYAHVVKIPKNKVYPYNEDPLNFAEEAERRFREKYPNQAFDANKELAWVSVVAAENGYDMTVANWDGLAGFKQTLRAQSPVKLKPEVWKKPKPGYYNTFDINEDLEFKSNRKKIRKQEPAPEITPEELKFATDLLKERFAGNEKAFAKALIKTDRGQDLIARGILQEVAKKTGSKPSASSKSRVEAVDKRLIESEKISEELKAKIQAEGTRSEVFSNEEAKQIADGYIAELGIDEAVKLSDEGYLKGSVKLFVYGAAIDQISKQIDEATTQEEKDALADKGAEVAASLQSDAEQYGRFIQAIGSFYKQSPLIIAKREVNRLGKASQDAFNRMINKKDKVEKTNQGLNYVRKKNVDPEAIKKIKTPRNEKEKTAELNKLRDLWSSLKAKGARQLSDYSDEQIDVLHRMAVIFYADGKRSFNSLYKSLKEETGISKSDFNELINTKLPADISPDGMSIVDLANEVNKPLVERVSKEKVEKSDIEKILNAGNRKKAEKSQNVPQKLYAIYGDLNKENRKKMYEDIKNNPDKSEDQLLAEWSSVLNDQQQQAVIDKHFPEKPTENKEKRKAEHEKIIDAYNSGIVNNKGGDKFKELFFDKFGLPKTNTEEMLKYIDEISKKLAKAPEGSIMWRETYEDLLDYIADNTYKNAIASGMDKLSAMWYANILSSPATHLRNLQYNAAQALVLNPLMIFEKALLKGDLGQLANINKGMIEGLKKGAIETGRVFRTGRGTRFDAIMERSLADRKLKLWSPVGRALRGSDIFFSDTAYQLKLREFARAMVKEEHPSWTNDEVNAKVNDLMGQTKERKEFASQQAEQELNAFYGENKPKDYETIKKIREFEIIEQTMPDNLKDKLEESKNWAKKSLLTNRPTGLFGVVSDLVGTLNKKLYATRFIIPFINVPLNVAQAMIERSPFGLIKAASTNTLHAMSDKFEYLNPDQKRELTLKAINYTVGMALLSMINGDDDDDELVITGNNTGEYMDDQGIIHAGGLEPMSVYVDGKKVMSYKTSPFASLLLPAGLMRDAKLYGETKNITDAISNAFINYVMFINDASAMQGLQGFFGAVADKKLNRAEAVRKWFGKQANALTPYSGAVKFITNTVNAAQGEADTRPIELYEYVVKDLPFVQDLVGVSTRRDHFGELVKEKFDIPLIPIGHRGLIKEISDISPYYKLMNEKGYLEYLKFPTKRTYMVGGKEVEISKKELDQLNTRRGEIVRKALNSKNVFKSKLKADSARRDMTTLEYLKTLDNELFKERMDQLFDEAGNISGIEKFGEQYGVTKSNLKDHLLELENTRSPRSKKEKDVPAKARINRKTLNDFKEKNIEIVIESL